VKQYLVLANMQGPVAPAKLSYDLYASAKWEYLLVDLAMESVRAAEADNDDPILAAGLAGLTQKDELKGALQLLSKRYVETRFAQVPERI